MPRVISRSVGRKLAVTLVAIVGFVLAYEISMSDSRNEAPPGVVDPTRPAAGSRQLFSATAYCKGTTTASGVGVRTGIAASDPALLPVGSVVNITTGNAKYNGVYTIMDTGPKVQGRIIDVYMWSCHEALAFGRQQIELTVLRLGWNPNQSTPSLIDRLFRRREAARNAPPPPLPPPPPLQPAVEPVSLEDGEEETAILEPQKPPVEPADVVPGSTGPDSSVPGSAGR
jgi:3D (Asp-Asp-Asp) domain-containing protein